MSVKRYTNGADDDQGTILPFMEESPNGDYVEYADYARLKAEVENSNRINTELLLLSNQQASEVRRLKAEVERLRKAGDWMCGLLRFDFVTKEWNAAKEGKPSV